MGASSKSPEDWGLYEPIVLVGPPGGSVGTTWLRRVANRESMVWSSRSTTTKSTTKQANR